MVLNGLLDDSTRRLGNRRCFEARSRIESHDRDRFLDSSLASLVEVRPGLPKAVRTSIVTLNA